MAPHPVSPCFAQVASWRSSKRSRQNLPRPHQPIRKGKILIQSDCSFGNFLLLKEKHKQNPFSLGKTNKETKLRSEGKAIMGADTSPTTAELTADKSFQVSAEQHRLSLELERR